MAAGAFAFSLMSALVKLVGGNLPLFEIIFGRSIVVAALAAAALRKQRLSFEAQEFRLLVQRAVLGFSRILRPRPNESSFSRSLAVLRKSNCTTINRG